MQDIAGLQSLGLTQHEARVYRALVGLRSGTVAAIAAEAGLPVPHAYGALRRLLTRAMVTGNHGKTKVYAAVAPEIALAGLHRQVLARAHAQAGLIKSLAALHRRRSGSVEPPPFFQVLRTPAGVPGVANVDRAREFRRARHEILALVKYYKPLAHKAKGDELLDRAELAALRKGVEARCVTEAALYDDADEPGRMEVTVKAGERQRVVKELPMTLTIVDRDKIWFDSADYREKGVSFRVNDRALGEVFAAAFEYYWERGVDIEAGTNVAQFIEKHFPKAARRLGR